MQVVRFSRGLVRWCAVMALAGGLLMSVVPRQATASPATTVASGGGFSCAILNSGAISCWGRGDLGQLGNGDTSSSPHAVLVKGLPAQATAVSAGQSHACAVLTDGSVYCWGSNENKQVGQPTGQVKTTATLVAGMPADATEVSAGGFHTCAVTVNHDAYCWGKNDRGQLGDGTATQTATPVAVQGLAADAASVSAGNGHTCALLVNSHVQCWGAGSLGQLGDGNSQDSGTPVDVGLTNVAHVSAGYAHNCVTLLDGSARCWGYNYYGVVGDGTNTDRPSPVTVTGVPNTLVGINAGSSSNSFGGNHTCAWTSAGDTYCWGSNVNGQLGDGTTKARSSPVAVEGAPGPVTSISAGGVFYYEVASSVGGGHTCAVTTDGRIVCWGTNFFGELGNWAAPGGANLGNGRESSVAPVQVAGIFPGRSARADALIALGARYLGNNIYNATGTNQLVTAKRKPGKTATYKVRIQNDGDSLDQITLKATGPASGAHLRILKGGVDVTDDLFHRFRRHSGRGWWVKPSETLNLTLKVTVGRRAHSGDKFLFGIEAKSGNSASRQTDRVEARVVVR